MTEQIFINFAVCFILRGRDTLIRLYAGRHDLPSDASREHFL